jgi:hypothetical protein
MKILFKYSYSYKAIGLFDIHTSVHCNIITNDSQQDATFLEFTSTDALHTSGGSSIIRSTYIYTALGIVKQYFC